MCRVSAHVTACMSVPPWCLMCFSEQADDRETANVIKL